MQVFNSTAALDFYTIFDGEDTSDGWVDRALNHERRFRQNGPYHTIPYSRYCIVDSREAGICWTIA